MLNSNFLLTACTRRTTLTGLASLSCSSLGIKALAHKLTTTETRVEITTKTGLVQVIHTFHTHDAEVALAKAKIIDMPDLTRLRQRAQMALYVEKTFSILQNGEPIDLRLVGAEIDRGNVLTYQEGKIELPLGEISITAEMMRSFVLNQINNVDVYIDGKVHSLQFRGSDGRKNILA
ncbi:hypothetical protein DES40_0631 [Litorimonas taeanensis]|uniref:Uncharacterized protein n=1 Tax=Litorimonas taeanensis TaxID=568099 RepID=A0A420WJY7_9PROT|nr:DUF6702 family protein [Litorimonas taeanensis]RKQ71318.1 hypothetical protein DES40_0631 [Litorimonas taeanensis]